MTYLLLLNLSYIHCSIINFLIQNHIYILMSFQNTKFSFDLVHDVILNFLAKYLYSVFLALKFWKKYQISYIIKLITPLQSIIDLFFSLHKLIVAAYKNCYSLVLLHSNNFSHCIYDQMKLFAELFQDLFPLF